jgi:cell wall-associated NlpC family hydrolase
LRRAAEWFQVSVPCAQRWAARYCEYGEAGMVDWSSQPSARGGANGSSWAGAWPDAGWAGPDRRAAACPRGRGTPPTRHRASVARGGIAHPRNKYLAPVNGDPGFDCSGLTHAAYEAAGVSLPRTAQTQYEAGLLLPPGTPLQPGDLLFFGTPRRVHHVGIFLGGTVMVHAPSFGEPVQVGDYRTHKDFLAASRPVSG